MDSPTTTDDPEQDQEDRPGEGGCGDGGDAQGGGEDDPDEDDHGNQGAFQIEGPVNGEQLQVAHCAVAGLGVRRRAVERRVFGSGKEAPAEQKEIQPARRSDDQADGRDFEETEDRLARIARHVVDQQVGRGADQGAGPAHDGDVAERDQEPLGGEVEGDGDVLHHRRGQDHDGGVVEEGGRSAAQEHDQPQAGGAQSRAQARGLADQQAEQA